MGWMAGTTRGGVEHLGLTHTETQRGRAAEVREQRNPSNDPRSHQHSPDTPTTGLRERGNDTSRSTGRSGRQNAATRRNMRREERVTVQGPVKKQQPDGMSHRGGGGGCPCRLNEYVGGYGGSLVNRRPGLFFFFVLV